MTTTLPPASEQTGFLSTSRGKLVLFLLAAAGFLDFVDASIVNVALPHIREDLHFSVQNLQWVVSGYLLTYGGFMLLGGRLADLIGRRTILLAGTMVFALSSLLGGLSNEAGELIAARLVQGFGAALMVPAALSLLTTSFVGPERHKVLAVWGSVAGLGSALGVLAGGLLTEGPGWRWVPPSGASVQPRPRRSGQIRRREPASSGITLRQAYQCCGQPCNNSNGGPDPASATWTRSRPSRPAGAPRLALSASAGWPWAVPRPVAGWHADAWSSVRLSLS